jgi:putative membrane protein
MVRDDVAVTSDPRPSRKDDPNLARDHLANERTFLAWIRTAAAVMALGLAVAGLTQRLTAWLAAAGALLVLTGVVGVGYSTVRFRRITRDLDNGTYSAGAHATAPVVAAAVLAAVVIAALVLIFVGQY